VPRLIDRITKTRLGRSAFKAVRPLIHAARHIAHPNIPTDQKVTKVSFRGKEFAIRQRRTYADFCVIEQCFTHSQYDLPVGAHGALMDRLHQEILDSGRQPLIIDCGANIGCSALWFIARYPKSHIVAVEPAPDNVEILRTNCAGLDIEVCSAGVGAEDGVSRIVDVGSGGWGYRTSSEGQGPEIPMISIGTILASKPAAQYSPFLLKIDIEGAEKPLFSGAVDSFAKFPLIIIEPHDWLFPGQLSSQEFFRFHVNADREFCMRNENVASIANHNTLLGVKDGLKN
jgi:FkbM family methyltransferase